MSALALVEPGGSAVAAISEAELITVLQSSLYPGAKLASIKMVLGYCKAAGLDPMQKPVHIVPMWDGKAGEMRDVVMPGVGLYRTQAARTGRFAGQTEPEFGEMITAELGGMTITYPEWARVTVKKQLDNGSIVEFTAKEYWIENYAIKGGKEKSIAPNAMWTKRPRGQIAKCAAAQALRLAFPEMGAQPTADEMEGKQLDEGYHGTTIDGATGEVLPQRTAAQPAAPEPWPDEALEKRLAGWKAAIGKGKTPEEIIAWAESKGALSEAQKDKIRALAAAPASAGDLPKVTYAEVADAIQKSEDQAALDAAALLIPKVADEAQRAELTAMADKHAEDLPAF